MIKSDPYMQIDSGATGREREFFTSQYFLRQLQQQSWPHMRSVTRRVLLSILVLIISNASVLADQLGLDYPHNATNAINCWSCHYNTNNPAGWATHTPQDIDDTPLNNLCWSCHNDVDAEYVLTHSSLNAGNHYGDWTIECITCHRVHHQQQLRTHGSDSYVSTATTAAVDATTVTRSGGNAWEVNKYAGYIVLPNINQVSYNYIIVSNTADTLTVAGPIDPTKVTAGVDTMAIIYGNLIKEEIVTPNSGTKTVKFFNNTGSNSFVAGDSTYDGVCEVCHTQPNHHRNDGSAPQQAHNNGEKCTSCHSHAGGFGGFDHTAGVAVLPVSTCMECHGYDGPDPVGDVHGSQCGLCHVNQLGGGPLVEPYETTTPTGGDCIDCHGAFSVVHSAVDHTAAPASGMVMVFADDDHDDAGWIGPKPYFDVMVDCHTCHDNDLPAIHGSVCSTCHPTPYRALGTWGGGCQQGGCHQTFHENSTTAHEPFAAPYDPGNDCYRCHEQSSWAVLQSNCLNCHATYGAGDHTPPGTSSNVEASYTGPANISFSVTDGGKVGIGTTFRRLDGGTVTTGSNLSVSAPGSHALEFWSVDQAGNVESPPNLASFSIIQDTTPPTTTSNAQGSYYQSTLITLTATDASSMGVKATYYTLNGGPTQTGTTVAVPGIHGTYDYTMLFWSEDWSGNVESPNRADFTVTGGTATLRLVWGDSDVDGLEFVADPEASAQWTIRRGGSGGSLVTIRSGSNPGWSGVDDVTVPVSLTPYYVDIWWWDSDNGWDDNTVFPTVYATTPGQIIRLSY